MKEKLRSLIGEKRFSVLKKLRSNNANWLKLHLNFYNDLTNYYRHSHVFRTDNFKKIESELILDYHGLEKGFLHEQMRYRFAEGRVKRMLQNLDKVNYDSSKSSQVSISLNVLLEYYDFHKKGDINIDDYFSKKDYNIIKLNLVGTENICTEITADEYFGKVGKPFPSFSDSRKSIRNFSPDLITVEKIKEVLDIAKNSPSVCNRQPNKVHFIQNKPIIDKVLSIQGGLSGFEKNINQLIVLTCDRNYFFSIGERNQLFIEGGVFLMNLLYALHYHKIAACPANWGKEYKDDIKMRNILNLSPSEKIICVVAIGYIEGSVKYTLSKRRSPQEILNVIN
jgi:nitroreductase